MAQQTHTDGAHSNQLSTTGTQPCTDTLKHGRRSGLEGSRGRDNEEYAERESQPNRCAVARSFLLHTQFAAYDGWVYTTLRARSMLRMPDRGSEAAALRSRDRKRPEHEDQATNTRGRGTSSHSDAP